MRAALLVLLLAIAACASAVRAPPPGPTVCQALDCLTCVELPNCGWCISQQACLINTTLTCDDCFVPAQPNGAAYCPQKLCSLYPDCGSCTTDPNCGWCGDNNKCVESNGCPGCLPGGATCHLWKASGDGNSNCSISTLCSSHTDCESCNTDPSCGWCGASLTCELAVDGFVCNSNCDGCVVQAAADGCPANHTKCADYSDCFNCVSQPLCGWCPTSLRCSESNDFGFCNGNCDACFVASGSPNSCPAPGKQCSDFTSCAACTDQPGCGWCPESAKCVPGTEFDQCSGSCPSCWQFGDDAECPEIGTTCSDYTDCASCTQQSGCGWCPVTGECLYGTDYDQCSGSCDACWQFGEESQCPAPHTTCANYTDCASCAAQDGCGWCGVSNVCVPGTDFDQCSGSCTGCWQFGDDAECPAAHTKCSDYKDCASCSSQDGCGWCSETGLCGPGTSDGPCAGSCNECWQYGESAECPAVGTACGNYSDCASCTVQNGCGWCPITETCVASNFDGPCTGSCSACFTTDADNCPSSGSCPQFTSQATCSAQSGCMWCTNSKTCVWGNGYEPCLSIQCTTN